jgi:crotonobetainyl-CoA:carnitine CoA-transferase CaiB-like acyl-CoA transferase
MKDFLNNIKVVELSSVLAGPAVGMFFAELGATVIKVENKQKGGDVTRNWRLQNETKQGPSAYYCSVNFGKHVMMVDLTMDADREKVYREVASADIVTSNFSERVASKLGMSFSELSSQNPRLIFLQLDGFSNSSRPAYDVVLQAETGWLSMTGSENQPAKIPVALIDVLAGHQLKEAALLALLKRERTGKGSFVRCNLEKASLSSLANQGTNVLMNHSVPQPIGTLHPNIAPYGDWFTSADVSSFVLAVGSDQHFLKLAELVNLSEADRDLFQDNVSRLKHRDKLQKKLQQVFKQKTYKEWEVEFESRGIPHGKIKKLDEVLESDVGRSMVLEGTQEGRSTKALSSIAFSTDFLDS